MNPRTILGLVAALGTSPAITSCATVPDKLGIAPVEASPRRSFLEEILAAPQTRKEVTVFYEFVPDDTLDPFLFSAAIPYVTDFYRQHDIILSFVPSANFKQEHLDGVVRVGLRYASPARMLVENLEDVSVTPEDDSFNVVVTKLSANIGITFRKKKYAIVSSPPELIDRWSLTADTWRLLRRNFPHLERYGSEVPADGEARLFAQIIAHELGHLFGLVHPSCTYNDPYTSNNIATRFMHAGDAEVSLLYGSPFTPSQPFGKRATGLERALMHNYLAGGAAYRAAQREEDYDVWLTKQGMPVCMGE